MRNFKFVGGPWDGEYHEVSLDCVRQGYFNVPQRTPFEHLQRDIEPGHNPSIEYVTYTLRHFTGTAGSVHYFADADWSDIYVISQLVHHYLGKP